MAQALLETGQHRLLVARFNINHPIRGQADLRERWCEQIGLGHAPQHLAGGACGDASDEQGRCRTVDRAFPAARDFVQTAQRHSAMRQTLVDGVHAKGQDDVLAC
jgi:hypothetical protein